eukprot:CAMPEP_0114265968 /NCGR_PEP_ID=MMETSP0058-20121206/24293_1 /TAXON_ID=36894 /ORGANISM="Pyramimonas parkeae, CCMP726" /LENGTH=138 /DNA_ID=CAMNT_0001383285 /DNA_START=286 /DNA_END=702 /DNA_ORIENTATION=-
MTARGAYDGPPPQFRLSSDHYSDQASPSRVSSEKGDVNISSTDLSSFSPSAPQQPNHHFPRSEAGSAPQSRQRRLHPASAKSRPQPHRPPRESAPPPPSAKMQSVPIRASPRLTSIAGPLVPPTYRPVSGRPRGTKGA